MTENENIEADNIEIKERMKQDLEMLKTKRKATLYWNIIFFVGIMTSTIIASVFSIGEKFSLKEFLATNNDKFSLAAALIGLFTSFLAGVLGVYFKDKKSSSKDQINIREFIKETYLTRIDNSSLNPNRTQHSI